MPEGPEHYKAAVFINKCCHERIFSGKVIKSEVNTKNPVIDFNVSSYSINAKSRGKEVMLTLEEVIAKSEDELAETKSKQHITNDVTTMIQNPESQYSKTCSIVFQFGMSGKFEFTSPDNVHKHSHLRFFTEDSSLVLSFVDVRRFGKWRLAESFSADRGPDPVYEYNAFRENVLANLNNKIFQKPICTVMHNQKYFNGLGNYLRAEILYRAQVPPFDQAYDVLKNLEVHKELPKKDSEKRFDLLEMCSVVPSEVMILEDSGYDKSEAGSNYALFESWLQCYCKPGMNNLIDADGRTIWFKGRAGSMAPVGNKAVSRHLKSHSKKLVQKATKKVKNLEKDSTGFNAEKKRGNQSEKNCLKRSSNNTKNSFETKKSNSKNISQVKVSHAINGSLRRSARLLK